MGEVIKINTVKKRYIVKRHDDFLIVVSKQPGLLTIPDRYDQSALSLIQLLRNRFEHVITVHRLDRDTSGLVVFALRDDVHRFLSERFSAGEITKKYLALVEGNPTWDEQTIDLPLRTDSDRMHRTRVDRRGGKPSATEVRIIERYDDYSLVEARPVTGRTHQIRAHLAAVGHGIACDALYGRGAPLYLSSFKRKYTPGKRPERPLIARVALHATELRFPHPHTGDEVIVRDDPWRDLSAAIAQLGKHGASRVFGTSTAS